MLTIFSCLVVLMFFHWFADFALQDDKTALEKSDNIKVLFYHCSTYAFWMGLGSFIVFFTLYLPNPVITALLFTGWMLITHFGIDYVTARANKKLWLNNQRHWFFVMVGFDQFLHISTIIWFYAMALNGYVPIGKTLF